MYPVFLITLGSLAIGKGIKQTDFSSVISDPGSLGNRLSQRRNLLFRVVREAQMGFSTSAK